MSQSIETYVADGIEYPIEDLFGYPDSLITARVDAAYRLGCELLSERPREVVVDVGSGRGHGVESVIRSLDPDKVISTEIVVSNLQAQRVGLDYPENVAYVQLDGQSLPFESDSIDTVFLMHVIEELKHPKMALAEIYRALRPQGELIVATPWSRNLVAMNPNDHHVFSGQEIHTLLTAVGFDNDVNYLTADEEAWEVHERKRRLANVPFARRMRRIMPKNLGDSVLRRGTTNNPLSYENFYMTVEDDEHAIDLIAVATKQ